MKTFMKLPLLGLILGSLLMINQASAHDGNHESGLANNLWHLFTEPDHLLVFLTVVLPLCIAFLFIRNRKAKQPKRLEQK